MLKIQVKEKELYNELTNTFITIKQQELCLEHSLVSISKWESKWHKPFISSDSKTTEETLDYIKCMTITQNVNSDVYLALSQDNINDINHYISDPMSATTFTEHTRKTSKSNEMVTSELIYYWMVALDIPMECQRWHLNRLLTLIRICNIKNEPPKKMGSREITKNNAALNAARRKRLHSKG